MLGTFLTNGIKVEHTSSRKGKVGAHIKIGIRTWYTRQWGWWYDADEAHGG